MGGGHETWLEKLIREAESAGEFDDLAGRGRPLADLDRPYDPAWWARRWMERESVAEAVSDVAARVRRAVPRILAGTDEPAMRDALRRLNTDIESVNQRVPESDRLPPLDVENMIRTRASRRRDS